MKSHIESMYGIETGGRSQMKTPRFSLIVIKKQQQLFDLARKVKYYALLFWRVYIDLYKRKKETVYCKNVNNS